MANQMPAAPLPAANCQKTRGTAPNPECPRCKGRRQPPPWASPQRPPRAPCDGGGGSPFTPLLFLSLPFPALPFPSRPFSAPFPAEGRPQPAAGWRQLPASWCHRYLVVTSAAGAGPCCMALAAALFPGQPRSPGGCDGNPRRMFAGGRFWCKRRAGEESREGGEKGGPEP